MDLPDLQTLNPTGLVQRLYGFKVTSQRKLNSTDDINIHVTVDSCHGNPAEPTTSEHGYVLKILNSIDSEKVDFVDAMHAAIECSIKHGLVTPTPVPNLSGKLFSLEPLGTPQNGDSRFLVRLFRYIPGDILFGKPCTQVTCYNIGELAAKLDKALMMFDHPALSGHKRHWSLTEVVNLGEKLDCIDEEEDRELIRDVVKSFKQNVAANYSKLQKGTIHADLNAENLLVKPLNDQDSNSYDLCISGVLDFGDLVHEYHVFSLGITIMYLMGEATSGDPIEAGGHLLAGYLSNFRFPALDLSVLTDCVCGRLAQSIVYGTYSNSIDPSNTYGIDLIPKKWKLLRILCSIPKAELHSKWRCILLKYGLDFETDL